MKILHADDSRMIRRIVVQAIELLGYEPIEARDGREALRLIEKNAGDLALVLLDWNMPNLSGYDVLCRLRSDERFRHIPVMMVTTESERSNVVRAIAAGAKSYLTKPFAQADLSTRILECLGLGQGA